MNSRQERSALTGSLTPAEAGRQLPAIMPRRTVKGACPKCKGQGSYYNQMDKEVVCLHCGTVLDRR